MKKNTLILICFLGLINANAQTNFICSAEQILLGNYNPLTYSATTTINHPDSISKGINARVSPDSLHAYLDKLRSFQNRNSGSDTISTIRGIGASRKWIYKKFQQFGLQNQNRLIPSYFQFDYGVCGINRHKNVLAVLPGADTTDKSIIIIEGHYDSRCKVVCDTACLAEGMEDNGSGTALVIELARVMSKYTYNHTIVFMATMGEEQGLYGAEAFADYVQLKGIQVLAVLNNDVIGGIKCGYTSSAPSCPGFGNIDSTDVRLFSFGGFSSFHKGLSRYIKLQHKELLKSIMTVSMNILVMTPEDRTNRGGDHIPFRQHGYTAMRFTAANENGDANLVSTYADRQHTSQDILGVDTNNDAVIDSFFVDFRYLARNSIINGNAAGMIGIGPKTPDFTMSTMGPGNLTFSITQQQQYLKYRVGLRTLTYDWDSVYVFTGTTSFSINNLPPNNYIASVASFDTKNVESLFSKELTVTVLGINELSKASAAVELLQNKPNPSDLATMITVKVNREMTYKDAYISIKDLVGKEVKRMKINLTEGVNEVQYDHGYNMSGTFIYTLVIDDKPIESSHPYPVWPHQ